MSAESPLKFMECTLLEMGFPAEKAKEFTRVIAQQFSGREIYIAKLDRDARRETVVHEFNGRNRKELCTKHGLSKAQFYRMLKGE